MSIFYTAGTPGQQRTIRLGERLKARLYALPRREPCLSLLAEGGGKNIERNRLAILS